MSGTSSDESKVAAGKTTNSLVGTYKFENVVLATTETWKSNAEISSDTVGQTGAVGGLTLANP